MNEMMVSLAPAPHAIAPVTPVAKSATRNTALDFTKGFLVYLMVFYHWFNYFVGPSGVYKYIRFLTPSFIFITGFIVSSIYFVKYDIHDFRLPARLATRGLKIIAVFVVLNAVVSVVLPIDGMLHPPMLQLLVTHLIGTATPGVKEAAFPVLVPIGELLLLSAVLACAYRLSRYVVHVCCALAFAAVILLRVSGTENPNAELIAIGLLGMVLGMVPLPRLMSVVKRPVILAVAYILFDIAVSRWGEIYALQVLGVCLSIAVIYLVGASRGVASWLGRIVVLIGKYSLVGYISQIAILQVLRRMMTINTLGTYRFAVSFVLAFVLTTSSIMLLGAARRRSGAIDRSYKFVFA